MNALLKLLVLALPVAAASNAHAHDWYPLPCCSDKDCYALLEGRGETVAETTAGWRLWDGRTIPHDLTIETAWVILNCARGWLGYSTLSMTADVSTAPKPDQ
jgi:hypothetical protein